MIPLIGGVTISPRARPSVARTRNPNLSAIEFLVVYRRAGRLPWRKGRRQAPRAQEMIIRGLAALSMLLASGVRWPCADIPELDVLFVGGFDEEASPLGFLAS